MIGTQQYDPSDVRLSTIEDLFWRQITEKSANCMDRPLDSFDNQFSE
ncbi:hypothetical protein HN587_00235 [Candidatus Woesearchaeota archaeon]|jgi:hypothetical protein|nr:hypothetical protein [Candidatus Woesearchaeota archaeon]